jgi:ATP-dependent DNA helicase RecG
VYGKPKIFSNNYSIPHPEIIPIQQADPRKGLKAIYSSTEKLAAKGLHSKGIEKLTSALVIQLNNHIPENLSLLKSLENCTYFPVKLLSNKYITRKI